MALSTWAVLVSSPARVSFRLTGPVSLPDALVTWSAGSQDRHRPQSHQDDSEKRRVPGRE